jgi:ATPase subunit of ABC transporter with duplicated ATPase domains
VHPDEGRGQFSHPDEPTNHLDIASREWIEQAVESYGETLLFVSHDRYFISRFATRIWEIEGGAITDFRARTRNTAPSRPRQKRRPAGEKDWCQPERTKSYRKKGAPSPEKQLAKLEREIAALEEKLSALEARREEYCSDYQKLIELDGEEAALREALDHKFAEWSELAEAM